MRDKILFSFATFLIFFSMLNMVSAEILTSSANVGYDSRILDAFDEGEISVNVIIYLKDTSKIDELTTNLSSSEFKFISKYPDIVAAEITQSGFDKLLNNSNVNEIHFNSIGSIQKNESENEQIKNERVSQKNRVYTIWIISLAIVLLIVYIIFKKKR